MESAEMQVFSGEAESRFFRRVVAITRIVRNSPNRWRDTVELLLECGHRQHVLRLNERNSPYPVERTRDLVGSEFACGKCMVIERIRVKALRRGAARYVKAAASGRPPATNPGPRRV